MQLASSPSETTQEYQGSTSECATTSSESIITVPHDAEYQVAPDPALSAHFGARWAQWLGDASFPSAHMPEADAAADISAGDLMGTELMGFLSSIWSADTPSGGAVEGTWPPPQAAPQVSSVPSARLNANAEPGSTNSGLAPSGGVEDPPPLPPRQDDEGRMLGYVSPPTLG